MRRSWSGVRLASGHVLAMGWVTDGVLPGAPAGWALAPAERAPRRPDEPVSPRLPGSSPTSGIPEGWLEPKAVPRAPAEIARDRHCRRVAGGLMLTGAIVKLGSFILPWAVAMSPGWVGTAPLSPNFALDIPGPTRTTISLVQIGASPIGLVITVGVVAFVVAYLAGKTWASPVTIVSVAMLSLAGTILDFARITMFVRRGQQWAISHGHHGLRLGIGMGPVAEVIGIGLLLWGGIWALRIGRRTPLGELSAVNDARGTRPGGPPQPWTWATSLAIVILFVLGVAPVTIPVSAIVVLR